jgi:hypothetical protein
MVIIREENFKWLPNGLKSARAVLAIGPLLASIGVQAGPDVGNGVPIDSRTLVVETSSMPVGGGKATLTIGALQRVATGYSGDYEINVFPYIFKNEKGKLAIVVSEEARAKFNQGKSAAITGTATTNGKKGETRRIDATVTPADADHGTLKLWFAADERTMTFMPAYHFVGDAVAKSTGTNVASNPVPLPGSGRGNP